MNLEYYRYIVAASECHSIRKAAEQLHLRQQNLSGTIKKIEQYYDITIFERNTKGITLTRDGEYFLEKIKQILEIANDLEKPYRYPSKRYYTSVVDHITLYIPTLLSSGLWVARIRQFNDIFPYVELSMVNRPLTETLQLLAEDEKSIAVFNLPFFETDFNAKLPDFLEVTQVSAKVNYTAVTRKDNPEAATLQTISMTELLKKKLVLSSTVALKENIFYRLLQYYGQPQIQYVIDNTSLFIDFMSSGNYWSLGKEKQSNRYDLKNIPLIEDVYSTVQLVSHKSARDSFIMQTLIKTLVIESST